MRGRQEAGEGAGWNRTGDSCDHAAGRSTYSSLDNRKDENKMEKIGVESDQKKSNAQEIK